MPRPIILTEEMKQKAKTDFAAMLDSIKMTDGKLHYNRNFEYENSDVTVYIMPEAYKKILALVTEFSDEVGWHGTVSRSADDEFIIENIFVYPQEVTGSTVNTDQTEYTQWLYELDDETFNKIRMQGHSHVNMGVSPSGVDDKHRQQILDQLEKNMFYIFMIWNKSLTVHTLVYDMARNVLYEDEDVDVQLLGDEDMDEFLADAKEKVQKSGHVKNKQKEKVKNGEQMSFCGDYDDFEYESLHDLYVPYYRGGRKWNY